MFGAMVSGKIVLGLLALLLAGAAWRFWSLLSR